MDVIQPEDYKFYKDDKNYNFKKNKAIIAETIAETKKFFRQMGQEIGDEGRDRIDMVSSYGVYRFLRGDKTFRNYIGEQRWKELIGEEILEKVRVMRTVNRLNGNTKYPDFILK